MERKTWGSLISCRDQPKTRSSVSGFSTQDIREKNMRASVKTACRGKTCLAFALSRAQRVCKNVSLYVSTGITVTSCVYSFPTDKFSLYFEKLSFQYLILFIFIYFAMSAFYSSSESSNWRTETINGNGRNAICASSAYEPNVWIFSRKF